MSQFVVLLLALSCVFAPTAGAQNSAVGRGVTFVNAAALAGLRWTHYNGASPEKYVLETMGSGAAFLDYNNDGWLDIYLVNGGGVPGHPPAAPVRNALYRNRGDGTFVEATAAAGVGGNGHYGMAVAAGDYDNDGWTDLYVTAFGRNVLYRNRGDGTFEDATERAGVAGSGWSSSAAWLDYDRDGRLDLFVARYVDYAFERNVICGDPARGIRAYCHPDIYDGVTSLLYHNNGDGTFSDASKSSGIASQIGKGLGVVAADFDGDGWIDLYVANDSVRNFLFRNQGKGTFKEIGIASGVALDEGGRPQAGMGTAAGDYDGDGRLDIIVTNLDREYNALYRNAGAFFADMSFPTGFAPPSIPLVGWGTEFFDFDNDGDLDILVANGHVIDNIEKFRAGQTYPQAKLLFENLGDRFREVAARHGAALAKPEVSRGAAFGDYDNDGDVDVLVLNLGGAPSLLRNDGGNRNNWLSLALEGTKSPRQAVGALVRVQVGARTLTRYVAGGGSYLSASDTRVHLGLGRAARAERIEIRWPSGASEVLENVAAGKFYRVREGSGIVNARAPAAAKAKGE
ncbi:MAG TPA: CRTAC1 family protein [Candidatus Xenobia bacterium]|nr:CRTAC1 family protein [Candidatus Xenobia bacterium]